MKINTNSNTYTILYAVILVVVVAATLAFISTSLKDRQEKNIEIEKKINILSALRLTDGMEQADDKVKFVEERYNKYITDSYLVDYKGSKIQGDAFNLELKKQYDLMRLGADKAELTLPVYICTLDNGSELKVLSLYGAGLWGPIWGYLSLEEDGNTIYGTKFQHKGETPGLGAEIATPIFQDQFIGKQIFEKDLFCGIDIAKGSAEVGNPHQVDGISGGTITSSALETSINSWLEIYKAILDTKTIESDE